MAKIGRICSALQQLCYTVIDVLYQKKKEVDKEGESDDVDGEVGSANGAMMYKRKTNTTKVKAVDDDARKCKTSHH